MYWRATGPWPEVKRTARALPVPRAATPSGPGTGCVGFAGLARLTALTAEGATGAHYHSAGLSATAVTHAGDGRCPSRHHHRDRCRQRQRAVANGMGG